MAHGPAAKEAMTVFRVVKTVTEKLEQALGELDEDGVRVRATWTGGRDWVLIAEGEHLPDAPVTQLPPAVAAELERGVRYFLDAEGFCWRDLGRDDGFISMARVNPSNEPTPRPWTYLEPVGQPAGEDCRGDGPVDCPRCRAVPESHGTCPRCRAAEPASTPVDRDALVAELERQAQLDQSGPPVTWQHAFRNLAAELKAGEWALPRRHGSTLLTAADDLKPGDVVLHDQDALLLVEKTSHHWTPDEGVWLLTLLTPDGDSLGSLPNVVAAMPRQTFGKLGRVPAGVSGWTSWSGEYVRHDASPTP